MDFKFIIFYLALVFIFWRLNPFFPPYFPMNAPFFELAHYLGTIGGSYIPIFLIFMFIKNYEEIKRKLLRIQTSVTRGLTGKHQNSRIDFIRFLIFSILITFSIDIILTKLSEQSFIGYLLDNTPIISGTISTIGFNSEDINTSDDTSSSLRFSSIKDILVAFIGPSIGAIILFFLRQLRYRAKFKNHKSYPGATLLFLFLVIALIAFTVDIYNDVSKGISFNLDLIIEGADSNLFANTFERKEESNTTIDYSNISKIIPYDVNHLIIFTFSNLIIPQFFMSIISIWIFDWYLFSTFWMKKQNQKSIKQL